MGTCLTCRHWKERAVGTEEWGLCEEILFDQWNRDPRLDTAHIEYRYPEFVEGDDDGITELITHESFGCVLHKPTKK